MIEPSRILTRLVQCAGAALAATLALAASAQAPAAASRQARAGDHIVAVVNSELVTATEVNLRMLRAREDAGRAGQRLPPDDELRRQVVEALIDDRAVLTYARDSGYKVDEAEMERAVANVAAQNQITPAQLRERLKKEGVPYERFRSNLRDQLLVERVREREVSTRVKVTDAEIDAFIAERRKPGSGGEEINIAQILVSVPEGADEATAAARLARARQAQARVRAGEDFAKVAAEVSQDPNRERGGELGMRPVDRLPDLFVEAVRGLQPGQMVAEPVRSGAGFHVLKLVGRADGSGIVVSQTHARHILLRPSAELSAETAARRLEAMRRQVESGQRKFEDLARQNSEDGSAQAGGDLGWVSPGAFVPEFEEAMDKLQPGQLSPPVASRFGIHLIQVLERRDVALDIKQVREQARNALREQKFDQAYNEWVRELRARAYVEMREPPQ